MSEVVSMFVKTKATVEKFPRKLDTPHIKVASVWAVAQFYNFREIKRILEGKKQVLRNLPTERNLCQLVAEYNSLTLK